MCSSISKLVTDTRPRTEKPPTGVDGQAHTTVMVCATK
jgi:hypothetical protein